MVECGSGTYIRSLAADLGVALGGCAHLAELRRLRVGSFTLDEAHPLDAVDADARRRGAPAHRRVRDLERVDVDDEQARAVRRTAPCSQPVRSATWRRRSVPMALVARSTARWSPSTSARGAACKPAVVLA